jgi:ATP-binding cassette subfamily B protein
MKLMLSYMKPHRALALFGVLIKVIATIFLLMIPFVLEHLVDNVVPRRSLGSVLLWGLVMILLAFFERLLNLGSNRISIKVARDSTRALRQDLFDRSIELSSEQADAFGLPSLTSRLTSDAYNVQSFIQNLQTFAIRAPILVLGSLALTLVMDRTLALILCAVAVLMVAAVAVISWRGIPLYDGVQGSVDEATRVLRENIHGIRVIKALSKEGYERARFERANEALKRREQRAGDIMSLPGPATTLFLNVGLVLIIWVGAKRVDSGAMLPGVILAFLTYFNMILMGAMGLNRIFMMLSKANASARRIRQVLRQPGDLPLVPEAQAARTAQDGQIVFDHVCFRYGGEPGQTTDGEGGQLSLEDISFSVPRGGRLGIIGPTGCGKTTLLNLMLRFYDPTQGHVFVDGRDVRTYHKDDLRRRFGVVLQNDMIFGDTLRENIAFGRDVSDQALRQAAEDARASEFIEEFLEKDQHRVASRGTDLSGGQRQRLLIARALAADPEILILDDASSALDYRTDAAVRHAIRAHHGCATTIVVAQRLSSIMDADEILVLDEGRILGRGTHQQLLESCGAYREIYKTQMGEGV